MAAMTEKTRWLFWSWAIMPFSPQNGNVVQLMAPTLPNNVTTASAAVVAIARDR